jgi:hypothetical protein
MRRARPMRSGPRSPMVALVDVNNAGAPSCCLVELPSGGLFKTAASIDEATALVGLRSKPTPLGAGDPFGRKLLRCLAFSRAPKRQVGVDAEGRAVLVSHSVGSRHM